MTHFATYKMYVRIYLRKLIEYICSFYEREIIEFMFMLHERASKMHI